MLEKRPSPYASPLPAERYSVGYGSDVYAYKFEVKIRSVTLTTNPNTIIMTGINVMPYNSPAIAVRKALAARIHFLWNVSDIMEPSNAPSGAPTE